MKTLPSSFTCAAVLSAGLTFQAIAQSGADTAAEGLAVSQLSTHMGEMAMTAESADLDILDTLRFEPFQQLDQMFFRDDVVYLMRHGPTDWSKLDQPNVAPTDCANQRIMSPEGRENMRDLGALMASNDVLPAQIVVSQWCRNEQTLESLQEGFDSVDPSISESIPVETDGDLNLLLSLQGAKNVTGLRERISTWDGDPERSGPLLVISHYTNIEELTQFRVFEGEILVLDPKRDNQVLGYLRLRSAEPDIGHFADALSSPLYGENHALDMVERYYAALNSRDDELFEGVLSERWFVHGESPSRPMRDVDSYLAEIMTYTDGIPDARFDIESLHYANNVVTVIGTIRGTHSGELFGYAPTGRDVEFGAIAVHRLSDGAIEESWQLPDRLTLLEQIKNPPQ